MFTRISSTFVVIISLLLLTAGSGYCQNSQSWKEKREIWFEEPAAEWRYEWFKDIKWFNRDASAWRIGLPIGNGRLGAMVLGTYPKERIQLNEDSIWAKEPLVRHPETTKDRIAEVQKLVEAGKYKQAHDLYEAKIIMNEEPPVGSYQTMGDLWIEHVGQVQLNSEGYIRKLDIATGLVTVVKPLSDGSVITEEVVSSAIDDCVAIRLATTSPEGLNFDASITRPFKEIVNAVVEGDDKLVLEEQARYDRVDDPQPGTKFYTLLKVLPDGGSVKGGEGVLKVRGAKAVTMLLTCSTDYNKDQPQVPLKEGWQKKAIKTLEKAQIKPWVKLKRDSMADVSSMMYRCDIDLGESPPRFRKLPTGKRLAKFAQTQTDPDLMELYFQFGRYLTVCSSRPGTMPTNLQGLWARKLKNPWSCDYHLNINIQLHYLSAEVTNLSECHQPLFWLLDMLRIEGRKMAKAYGAKGFCTNHDTNPWGRTINRCKRARWSGSVITGQWASMNIMEHYRYTGDKKFLRDTGWPILREGCEFVESWIIRDKKTGKWVGKAGCSQEIGFYYTDENGEKQMSAIGPVTAYDLSIIWQAMSDYLEAAEILGVDDEFTKTVRAKLAELEMPRIGKDGRILEWGIENVEIADRYHRHLSHLLGLHPGSNQITAKRTPELFEAAKKSLIHRGTPRMGWSESLKISLYARVFDGNAALGQFKQLLSGQTQPNLLNLAEAYMNLDGNYGTPAGIVEMLMQSHDGDVHLLPAIPDEWRDGSISGIVARGGFVIDMEWKGGRLVKADILSRLGGELNVRYGDQTKTYNTKKGQRVTFVPKPPAAEPSVTSKVKDDGSTELSVLSADGKLLKKYQANLSKHYSPATKKTAALKRWESYRFGALLSYNSNQFSGLEFCKTIDPKIYNPKNLKVKSWVDAMTAASMKYAVLTTRHTSGFLLWDSPTTNFDVGSSGNTTDVVREFVDQCRKQDIAPGLYYCMWGNNWDKNPNARAIILAQLHELATNYGTIPYFWIDMMNWAPKDLSAQEVYDLIKSINPETIVIMNQHVQDGTTINYFPTDILNGEIKTPPEKGHQALRKVNDKTYYLPFEFESVSQGWTGRSVSKTHLGKTSWFTYGPDKSFAESTPLPPEELYKWIKQAYDRGASNVLLSFAPDYNGSMRKEDVKQLKQLGKLLKGEYES